MSQTPKVPIIGGGPAGMSCALWLHNYGLGPVIIEQERALGGMARRNPYPNPWLLGRPGALARDNAAEFARHIDEVKVETWLGGKPRRAYRRPDGLMGLDVVFSDERPPQSLSSFVMVIATGTEFRSAEWLDQVANARTLVERGRVHIGPGWAAEPGAAAASHVAVIGGGDNAFDVASILLDKSIKVSILMRSEQPRAQKQLVERVRAHAVAGLADVRAKQEIVALEETGAAVRALLSDGSHLEVDHILLLLGYRPNAREPWLSELPLETDARGYFVVDGNMETSCWGVFAVGDVANPVHPCTATAIASGTMAAREIQKRLTRHGAPSPRT
jgi:thioredoxin reductase (NADPH)